MMSFLRKAGIRLSFYVARDPRICEDDKRAILLSFLLQGILLHHLRPLQ